MTGEKSTGKLAKVRQNKNAMVSTINGNAENPAFFSRVLISV